MVQLPVYLDYNATTPCDEQVLQAMLPYFTKDFGNAASLTHAYGWKAAEAVEYAREQVADLIGADKTEIIFTSGATESDNLALKGVFETYAAKGNHIITTSIEHKAVLDTCKHLEKSGAEITYLPVDKDGLLDIKNLEKEIRPTTILISVMYANNEIGVIQPMQEIAATAKKHGIIFFSDATQAIGKIEVNVQRDGIDLLALSAHKIYGPKGCGVLYVRRKNPRVKLIAQIDGGGHERARRSGTLNVPGIVGLGKACEISKQNLNEQRPRLKKLRDRLEKGLSAIDESYVNGSIMHRLPNTTNMGFKNVEGNALMIGLQKNIAVSSGSACTSASLEPSFVLKALHLPDELAKSSLRFSLGRYTTEEEIDYVIKKVSETVASLREMNPVKVK
jgi:cysteine desulfurase